MKPEDELKTLAEIADAVMNSEIKLDPGVKENLEETILDNIIEIAEEAPEQDFHFIPEEADYEDQNLNIEEEEKKVKEFVDENDIMTADDPFSQFLRDQM